MLPASSRLTSSRTFTETVRRGRRAGTSRLVLHLVSSPASGVERDSPARVGFVVSRAVGGAVVRNKVKRRLRHAARRRLSSLPVSAALVVRALPPAADATYDELTADFDTALARLGRDRGHRTERLR